MRFNGSFWRVAVAFGAASADPYTRCEAFVRPLARSARAVGSRGVAPLAAPCALRDGELDDFCMYLLFEGGVPRKSMEISRVFLGDNRGSGKERPMPEFAQGRVSEKF